MYKWTLLSALIVVLAFGACKEKERMVEIETEYGTMKAVLYNSTPKHRDNFIKLAEEDFYDGLLFHRVIKGFMIQGGDPQSKDAPQDRRLGGGGPGYTIEEEIGAHHFKGALAAARQGDAVNPEKKSSGSQFYIVQGRPVNPNQLDQIAKSKNIEYTEEERQKYINEGGTPFLDGDYTVFGMVVEGKDVIDKIAQVQTGPGDRPVEDIEMKVRVVK